MKILNSKSRIGLALVAALAVVWVGSPLLAIGQTTELRLRDMDPITTPVTQATGPIVHPSVSWAAIFGGAIVALSLQMLFTVLGAGIGAAAIDP